jgi:hypothetical protein
MQYGVARVTVSWYGMCVCLYCTACTLLAAAPRFVLACGYRTQYGLLAALQVELQVAE